MDESKVLTVDGVKLSEACLGTLEYLQRNDNLQLKQDLCVLKNIMLYLALAEPEQMIPKEERMEMIGKLGEFIVMVRDVKG